MASSDRVVGTCNEMCSEREIKWRERNGLLHYFEINSAVKPEIKADPTKVVKQFSRSAAGKQLLSPSDLRPSPVLLKTIDYLVEKIVPRTDLPWVAIYDFVNDRIQAIRQDMTIQMIEDNNAVEILEKCVRFYITASYILCEEPSNKFDQHLNSQQLSICLERLFTLYHKFKSKNMSEFIAIYFVENVAYSETYYRSVSVFSDYLKSYDVKICIQICTAYTNGNFIRFFKLVKKLPIIILLCLFHLFSSIHISALETLNVAFSSNVCNFPISTLCSWLSVTDKEHLLQLCQNCGIKIDNSNVCFNKKLFNRASTLPFKKEAFIDEKLKKISLSKLINGLS
ncbi:germinal-center associated nuclear protein-like [Argiope bruennichi]|uniref:germinal-center associated nuclear protein-like n=1 Tax=Argiope bruennichi TaxID=94029 RepID=UPI002494EEDF|nr:germinal-center associated nuclear protein-like [Argiope bruennichi]